jgi:adenine deaminase
MSDAYAEDVSIGYAPRLTREAKAVGSPLHAPYMTLSFLALLVHPRPKTKRPRPLRRHQIRIRTRLPQRRHR